MLTREQIEQCHRQEVLTVGDAVPPDLLKRLRGRFAQWVAESGDHSEPRGETADGRPRFDVEPGHRRDQPALRRVNSPADISEPCFTAITDSPMSDTVADLIGRDVRHHHRKINSKLPGSATRMSRHRDFCYTPHSNTGGGRS